jgi:hypothetical protein
MSLPTAFFQPEFSMSSFILGMAVGVAVLATYIVNFEEPLPERGPIVIKCVKEKL